MSYKVIRTNGYIYHSSTESNTKFKPKYYRKEKLGNNKHRYFYTKEEYDAWKNDNKPNEETTSKKDTKIIGDTTSKTSNTDKLDAYYSIKNSLQMGKNIVDKIAEEVDKGAREFYRQATEQNNAETNTKQKQPTTDNKVLNELTSFIEKYVPEQEDQAPIENNKLPELPVKKKVATEKQDQAAVNPNYLTMNEKYANNCMYCTATYELRQRGYDVEAAPMGEEYAGTWAECKSWYENPPEVTEVKLGEDVDADAKKIEKDLLSHGEGARGNFVVRWKDGNGHSVVWEVKNGKVVIRDCQTNTTHDVKELVYYSTQVEYMRTDNLEVSRNILEVVKKK